MTVTYHAVPAHRESERSDHMAADRAALNRAILTEIATLLDDLVAKGEEGEIDLRSLPMAPGDLEDLDARLGRGEVAAIIDVAGESEIWETHYAGVWRVRHRGGDGRVAVDTVAVARVPAILMTHADDAGAALARLRAMLDGPTTDIGHAEARDEENAHG